MVLARRALMEALIRIWKTFRVRILPSSRRQNPRRIIIDFSVTGEANKLLGDYKFKLQKAEQDVSTLQANVSGPLFNAFFACVYNLRSYLDPRTRWHEAISEDPCRECLR